MLQISIRSLIGLSLLACVGCAKTPPPVVEVRGVVLLNGEPLPHASLEFLPQLEHFGAEFNSTAITDDKGRFILTCQHQQKSGAVVGKHKVLVSDAIPEKFRSQRGETQAELARYLGQLKNRPIPEAYAALMKTPLRVEVTAEQQEYTLKLQR